MAFPRASQREPLSEILANLDVTKENAGRRPILDVLIALDKHCQVLGGVHGEYYARSVTSLISYLAVVPEAQGRGVGKLLFQQIVERLQHEIPSSSSIPLPIFGECNDPTYRHWEPDSMNPTARLRVLDRLGMLALQMRYVQPPLAPDQPPDEGMILLIHKSSVDRDIRGYPNDRVIAFLRALYEAAGFEPAEQSSSFAQMHNQIANIKMISLRRLINH